MLLVRLIALVSLLFGQHLLTVVDGLALLEKTKSMTPGHHLTSKSERPQLSSGMPTAATKMMTTTRRGLIAASVSSMMMLLLPTQPHQQQVANAACLPGDTSKECI